MSITTSNQLYSTSDLTLAVTLSLFHPIESIDKTNPRKAIFFFLKTPELEKFIISYLRDEIKVAPQTFFNQLRTIKTRLYNIT